MLDGNPFADITPLFPEVSPIVDKLDWLEGKTHQMGGRCTDSCLSNKQDERKMKLLFQAKYKDVFTFPV